MSDSDLPPLKSKPKSKVHKQPAKANSGSAEENQTKLRKAQSLRKARRAYHNAKWRCANDPDYGAVKFLFKSCEEFLGVVGLPKSTDYSLERINPHGHYEPGNVKWANKSVQSSNKKKSLHGSVPTVAEYCKQAEAMKQGEANRDATAGAWDAAVRYYNGLCTAAAFREALADAHLADMLRLNSFSPGHFYDHALPPGIFYMPALTDAGRTICLNGGPFADVADSNDDRLEIKLEKANQRGVIRNLGQLELSENIAGQNVIRDCLLDETHSGICWVGMPDAAGLRTGWIEGMMLCVASRMYGHGADVGLFPARHVIEMMPEKPWEMLDGILGVEFLFMPDFQVDAGHGWTSTPKELGRLIRLLEDRVDAGRKTFIGIQNLQKLMTAQRNTILRYLKLAEFDASQMPPKPTIAEVHARATKRWCEMKAEGRDVGPMYR